MKSNKLKRYSLIFALSACTGFVLVECIVKQHRLEKWPVLLESRIEANRNSIKFCQKNSILLLGDSSLGHGVDSELLAEELNHPICTKYLYGRIAVYNDYWMLKDALDNQMQPRALVLVHGIEAWSNKVNKSAINLLKLRFEPNSFDSIAHRLFDHLSITRKSQSFRSAFLYPGLGFISAVDGIGKHISILKREVELIQKLEPVGNIENKDWENTAPLSQQAEFSPEYFQMYWLDKTIELATANNVPVVLANGPAMISSYRRRWQKYKKTQSWLAGRVSKHHRAELLTREKSLYLGANKSFSNSRWHLKKSAQPNYTRWFSKRLRARLRELEDE